MDNPPREICTLIVDLRHESYRSCFTRSQAERLLATAGESHTLQRIVDNLAVNWRSASDAAGTPAEILENACRAPSMLIPSLAPGADLRGAVELICDAVSANAPQYIRNPEFRPAIQRACKHAARKLRAIRSVEPLELQKDDVWAFLMKDGRFGLRIATAQKLCYMTVYASYELFIIDCLKAANGRESLRTSDKDFKGLGRQYFGVELFNECWHSSEVNIARVARHAIAHASGRLTDDLRKLRHGFRVHDGSIHIWPADNWRLTSTLCDKAEKLISVAAGLPEFTKEGVA